MSNRLSKRGRPRHYQAEIEALAPGDVVVVWTGDSKGYAYNLGWKLRSRKIVDIDFEFDVHVLTPDELDPVWQVVVARPTM